MSKRRHSAGNLPPAKRLQTTRLSTTTTNPLTSFENLLYDELILSIFSYLSWLNLCNIQSVNRNWARLSGDNELWRTLYLKEFGRSRLRGSRGFISRQDGREVRPLPVHAVHSQCDQYRDWKWMFRISSNWRRGRCLVEENAPSLLIHESPVPPPHTPGLIEDGGIHVVLAGPLIIVASNQPSERPAICVSYQDYQECTLVCEPPSAGQARITSLALDQAAPKSGRLSLACFLSTGDIFVFSFSATDPSSRPKSLVHRPSRQPSRTSNVIEAAYYHPLLVTLVDPFSLSIYDLSTGIIRHTQTLTAFTCYPPASLVLSSRSTTQFKLVITYTTPVYPEHWSVGATEIQISSVADISASISTYSGLSLATSDAFKEDFRSPSTSTISVVSTRTIRAFDVPNGWIDSAALQVMREQWGRKVLNVAAAQTDGKWVILAPGNDLCVSHSRSFGAVPTSTSQSRRSSTGLQLYRLVLPANSNSISTSPPKLNFVKTLHGHTSAVSAVALADGRCISLGENGSIWVWDLEAGSGAEVASCDETQINSAVHSIKGTIAFDERRIVSAVAGKLVVRRFDI